MIMEKYPFSTYHEMNLDWLISTVKKLDKYIENLNVDEIIKQLVEDGTIYDHFGGYFNRYYLTYQDMQNDTELQNGMIVLCFGYKNPLDGGFSYFAVFDNAGTYSLACQNGLYANLAIEPRMEIVPFLALNNDNMGAAINNAQSAGVHQIFVRADLNCDIDTQINLYYDLEVSPETTFTLKKPIFMYNATLRGGSYVATADLPVQSMIQLKEGINTVDKSDILVNVSGKIGIGCFDGKGVITNCYIDGDNTGQFGIWGEKAPAEYTMDIRDCTIENFYLNGLFTEAKSCLVSGCTFDHNHVKSVPNGGGQICLKGGTTQGYNEIMNCQIKNPGGAATSGIELMTSANAIIHGNYIHNQGSSLDGIAIQDGCFADVYDNTLHGSGIHLYYSYSKVNTHDNWYASITGDNIRITDVTQSGAIKEKRFTGDLITITSAVKPLFDVEGYPALKESIAAGANVKVSLYEDDVFTLIDATNSEMVTVFGTKTGGFLVNGTLTNLALATDGTYIKITATNDCDVLIYRS